MEKIQTNKASNVAEYIASVPDSGHRATLEQVRAIIKNAAPGVEESISYQIPAYRYHGVLIYFGAWKNHWALYPVSQAMKETFNDQLAAYKLTKGGIQFPWDEPFPRELITRLVAERIAENLATEKQKATKSNKK
ncbi:iron chaperone [Parapedobacter lycopersici]|uniref:iron chaperone n=1 Tax=Parapedobacter lycopersici TaxID=1864939 RepID=UPI00214DB99E|nr:DUF1801 domain-containing protein [Parapedobacter lycopersici]